MEQNYKTVSKLLFPDEQDLNKTPSQKFDEILRKKLKTLRSYENPKTEQETQIDENIQELANFIQNHVITVGKEQAVLDFQVGLNLLEEVNNSTVDNLKEIVTIVFEYQKQKKYKPLKVKQEILEQIFHGESLLEEYFKELYS